MARKTKQTVDYFPHSCKGGKSLHIIKNRFGTDGYTLWFTILEQLGSTEGHFLNLFDPAAWEYLLSESHVESEKAIKIIESLVNLGCIDKHYWEKHRVIWSDNFVKNLEVVYSRRFHSVPQKSDICQHLTCNCKQKPCYCNKDVDISTQSKVKESKVKESKEDIYTPVIEYLNKKCHTNYKATTPKTRTLIHARQGEGFSLDNFFTVIDNKCAEWLTDNKMKKYLRPETLFGTKFESYLNEKGVANGTGNSGQSKYAGIEQ